jgi:outer membrane protein assembly factor BamB
MKNFRIYLFLIVTLLLSGLLSACAGNAAAANSWPGVAVDAANEAVYVAYGPHVYAVNLSNGTEKWRFPAEVNNKISFYASPALTEDGQIIAGGYDDVLYSLDALKGEQKWPFSEAKNDYIATPLVRGNRIFAPSGDYSLYALDLQGNLLWSLPTENALWGTPAMDGSMVFLPAMDHHLYALDAETGEKRWVSSELGAALAGTPALGKNGEVFVGTLGSEMIALSQQDGSVIWRFPTNGWVWSGATLVEDVLYFGDLSGTLYAVNASDGTLRWKIQPETATKRGIAGAPLVLGDTLYFVSESGNLFAVALDGGTPRWNKTFKGKLYSGPFAAGDTILIAPVGSEELLIALDTNGNQKWVFVPPKKK